MLLLALGILLDTSLRPGDQWTTERSVHLMQEPDHIDRQTITNLSYTVVEAGQDLTVLKIKTIPDKMSDEKPDSWTWAFHANGTLAIPETVSEPDFERINRMIWTALEPVGGNCVGETHRS